MLPRSELRDGATHQRNKCHAGNGRNHWCPRSIMQFTPAQHQYHCSRELVPVPDKISYLSHPFLTPVANILLIKVTRRVLAEPAFARQLHARSIRPYFPRFPGGVRIAWRTPPSSVCAPLDRHKTFRKTIMRCALFLCQCRVSHHTIIVDLSKQGQTLAREPDYVVVELVNHLIMNFMLVPVRKPTSHARMESFIGIVIAQRLIFVKIGIPNSKSESACRSRSEVQRPE